MTAFVLNYRCGAVPDLHRVPSCRTRANECTNDESIIPEGVGKVKGDRKMEYILEEQPLYGAEDNKTRGTANLRK